MNEEKIPFAQRHGFTEQKPIYDDFPEPARVALSYLMEQLDARNYLRTDNSKTGWVHVINEFCRTIRIADFDFSSGRNYMDDFLFLAKEANWIQLFTFCERVYDGLLNDHGWYTDEGDWVQVASIQDARDFYTRELNTILAEENIGYHFVDGEFQRRGRAQTQQNMQRVGSVLGDEQFREVRLHYNKARKHFQEFPAPDSVNCVKESLNALEACLEVLSGKSVSKGFAKVVSELKGNGDRQIPPPIAEGMIKLHGYRGSGKGVSHAALSGNKVTELEAELTLSLTAAYITYLVDLIPNAEDDIPF